MGTRLHTCTSYKVEYGSDISKDLTDQIVDIIRNSETGWINDSEDEFEIDFYELSEIIDATDDPELKKALETIYKESDKSNNFVRLSYF